MFNSRARVSLSSLEKWPLFWPILTIKQIAVITLTSISKFSDKVIYTNPSEMTPKQHSIIFIEWIVFFTY